MDGLKNAYKSIQEGQAQLAEHKAGELLAEDLLVAQQYLKVAQQYLNSITGQFTSDDLLGEIFSNFCIGK